MRNSEVTPKDSIDWYSLEFMTTKEVTEFLEVGRNHVQTLVGDNHLPVFRIGGALRMERREIEAYKEIAESPELVPLHRVRRARLRGQMMLERRLPFDVRHAKQSRWWLQSKHMTSEICEKLEFRPPEDDGPVDLLTEEEVSERLRISEHSLTMLRLYGNLEGDRLPHYNIRGHILFSRVDMELYLASVRYEVRVD